jgi:hypothetical protein
MMDHSYEQQQESGLFYIYMYNNKLSISRLEMNKYASTVPLVPRAASTSHFCGDPEVRVPVDPVEK